MHVLTSVCTSHDGMHACGGLQCSSCVLDQLLKLQVSTVDRSHFADPGAANFKRRGANYLRVRAAYSRSIACLLQLRISLPGLQLALTCAPADELPRHYSHIHDSPRLGHP